MYCFAGTNDPPIKWPNLWQLVFVLNVLGIVLNTNMHLFSNGYIIIFSLFSYYVTLVILETLLRGLLSQHYCYNNTKMLFLFFTFMLFWMYRRVFQKLYLWYCSRYNAGNRIIQLFPIKGDIKKKLQEKCIRFSSYYFIFSG